ncbi:MAG TPA: hypothetical protein VGD17_09925 [Chitinophagaceae bacterium]
MYRYLVFCVLLVNCSQKKNNIEGAYYLVTDTASPAGEVTMRMMREGYWIKASYLNSQIRTFTRCSGGTYLVKDGRCLQTKLFDSYEILETTPTDTFEISFGDAGFKLSNAEASEKYQRPKVDAALTDTTLEGVWQMVTAEWWGTKSSQQDFTQIKMFVHPCFMWVQYKPELNEFLGAGGGTYHYDGKQLLERLEFFSFRAQEPSDNWIQIRKTAPDQFYQVNAEGAGKESWQKINPKTK